MIQSTKRLFRNLKISTEIFLTTATLILFVSCTYAVVNYLNLSNMEQQVNDQVNLLITQQDTLIQYYTTVTAETLYARVENVHQFAGFVSKFAYLNTLYNFWNVSEGGDLMACKEVQINLTDSTLGSLRDTSKNHNTPISSRVAIPGFFSSVDTIMSLADQQTLISQFGNNLNIFNFAMRDSFSSFIEERIGLLTIQMITNTADNSDYKGIFHVFPGGCSDVDHYRPKVKELVNDLRKVLAADTSSKDTDIERRGKLHMLSPYYDPVSQKWVSLSCSYYSMGKPFWRQVTIGTKTYNTSTIGCMIVDLTKLLDYKLAVNNTKVLVPPTANQTLVSISNSYMITTDNNSRVLQMPKALSTNYNYTSLFSPELVRYTGCSSANTLNKLLDLDHERTPFVNFTENLASDPTDPSLVDAVQIHARSVNVSHKHPVEPSYNFRSIIYFNVEDLTASKNLIVNNIKNAQSQISFLALIVIIIISAVVICISFQ